MDLDYETVLNVLVCKLGIASNLDLGRGCCVVGGTVPSCTGYLAGV
jgi:hypothetical protein